jgi:large subunit ribosomal protein L9
VTSGDIADFLKANGVEVDRRKLILPEAIKTLGSFDVPLKLHRQVTVPLKVRVVREGAPREAAAPAPAAGDQPVAE